jgi:primosomal protein N' (replication factor Y)
MYAIDIYPLSLIPRNQSQVLSYYHLQNLKTGAVVEVELNHRKIIGIVVASEPLKNRKLLFKKVADFELKKISKVISGEPIVSEIQLKTAGWLSEYYYSPIGLCLKHVLPPFFLKKNYNLSPLINDKISSDIARPKKKIEPSDYLAQIKKFIKDEKQVFLMVPENTSGKYFFEKFSELDPVYINSGLKNKEYYEVWKKVLSGGSKLIIGTRAGLFLPYSNLGLIIVDDGSNEAYKSDITPRYYAPDLAKYIADLYGAETNFSAILPRFEQIDVPIDCQFKTKSLNVVNMISEIKAGNFSIFSRDLKNILQDLQDSKNKLILFVGRRGYSNYILCDHCGQTLQCPNCSASLVVHEFDSNKITVCHHCNFKQEMPKSCPKCGSYKLKPHGIGIEKVFAELKKFYQRSDIKMPEIFQLDSDSVKTEEDEANILNGFMANNYSILLSTQILLSYKHKLSDLLPKPIIGIISTDALINIPDFRSEEQLMRQFMILSSISDNIILQTNNPDDPAISYFSKQDISSFVKSEMESRKVLNYPPFSKLIKLSYRHGNELAARRETYIVSEKLRQIVKQNGNFSSGGGPASDWEIIGPATAFISKEKGSYIFNILIKDKNNEIDEIERIKKRNEILRIVPNRGWVIDIDPRTAI